ncbi:hypothetical protein [[Eubacterium] cellulosolvens]
MLLFILCLPQTSAHVPVESGDNDSIDHALHIHDPLKSWAIYDELSHIGQARYYSFDLQEGDRLKISIFTPEEKDFTPNLMVMTPSGYIYEPALAFVEIPEGYNFTIIQGERPTDADYEPFTPSANFRIVDYDETVEVSGKYYIAVYEQEHVGKFGIAIGYQESFSLTEWLLIPYDVINIHLWEGQNIGIILAPLIIVLIVGKTIIFYRHFKQQRSPSNINTWLGSITAILYIGTGGILLNQMLIALSKTSFNPAAGVTLIFIFIPIILGIAIFKITLKENGQLQLKDRIYFVIYGLLGLFLWAGLIIGPIILILASLIPNDLKIFRKNKNN